jgi:MFS family permease
VSAQGPAATNPFALFGDRNFALLWSAGLIANVVRWLEMLAVGIYVFQVTGSAFQVALMTIARMAPLAVVGMFAGAIAERGDRRAILIGGYALSTIISATLGVAIFAGVAELWHVALGCLLNGIFWSTDFPARRALLAEHAGMERVGSAMSLDSITGNGTRMLGPAIGGAFMATTGLGGAYLFGAGLYVLGLLCVLGLSRPTKSYSEISEPVLPRIAAGLRHVVHNRALMGTLMVTVVFNLFGFPVTAMVPVIGEEILHLSEFPLGLLASAEGAGALISALLIATVGKAHQFKRLYFIGVFLYLNAVLLFASSTLPVWSGIVLFVMGLGAAGFAAMQATLSLLNAAPEYRSRVMGVVTMCIGTGPIGFAHLGLMADALGAPMATAVMAVEGIVALLLVALKWPEIL